jgi:hypothetical protein
MTFLDGVFENFSGSTARKDRTDDDDDNNNNNNKNVAMREEIVPSCQVPKEEAYSHDQQHQLVISTTNRRLTNQDKPTSNMSREHDNQVVSPKFTVTYVSFRMCMPACVRACECYAYQFVVCRFGASLS